MNDKFIRNYRQSDSHTNVYKSVCVCTRTEVSVIMYVYLCLSCYRVVYRRVCYRVCLSCYRVVYRRVCCRAWLSCVTWRCHAMHSSRTRSVDPHSSTPLPSVIIALCFFWLIHSLIHWLIHSFIHCVEWKTESKIINRCMTTIHSTDNSTVTSIFSYLSTN